MSCLVVAVCRGGRGRTGRGGGPLQGLFPADFCRHCQRQSGRHVRGFGRRSAAELGGAVGGQNKVVDRTVEKSVRRHLSEGLQ